MSETAWGILELAFTLALLLTVIIHIGGGFITALICETFGHKFYEIFPGYQVMKCSRCGDYSLKSTGG